MEIKYKIWIEKDGKVIFGKGRDNILKAVEDRKSLNAAAKKLGDVLSGRLGPPEGIGRADGHKAGRGRPKGKIHPIDGAGQGHH
jgi:hypothetical protein